MKYTHITRQYRATALQWNGDNSAEIIELLGDATMYGEHIMWRHEIGISTLKKGDWVLVKENGDKRIYTDEFLQKKYLELPDLIEVEESFGVEEGIGQARSALLSKLWDGYKCKLDDGRILTIKKGESNAK